MRGIAAFSCVALASVVAGGASPAFGLLPSASIRQRHSYGCRRRPLVGSRRSRSSQRVGSAAMVMPPALIELGAAARCVSGLYFHALHNYPLSTNIVQGAILAGLGDLISQHVERKLDGYPPGSWKPKKIRKSERARRVVNAAIAGIIFSGLAVPVWYNMLHSAIPGNSARAAVAKMVLDCSFFSLTGNGAALILRECLAGAGVAAAWRAMVRNIVAVMIVDLKVWPVYDLMCFTLIPETIQPLSTAAVTMLWNAFMSFVVASDGHKLRKKKGKDALPKPVPVAT